MLAVHNEELGPCEQEEVAFHEIERLQDFGVNAADITKLKGAGICTIAGLFMQPRKVLLAIKGLSEAKCQKILDAASKIQTFGFKTGMEVLRSREHILKITTGCKALDQLLGGGVESMSITEAFGEFRTGKTQLCHTLCVTSQLPMEMGGGNGKVIFIDTEGTFRPERVQSIAHRFGVDPSAVLENILCARAYTSEHQAELLTGVAAKMTEEHFALLVVDSVTALFRVDYSGRGELAERQQKLGQFMSRLMKIAEEFNVVIFITNQVVADPGSSAMFIADAKKPIGGHILAHASTTRLSLRKGRGEQRICKIYDSPCLPELEAVYQLTDGGIADVKD